MSAARRTAMSTPDAAPRGSVLSLPAPVASPHDDTVTLSTVPLRVVAIYHYRSLKLAKPSTAKGARPSAPQWLLSGGPVDTAEEQRRISKKQRNRKNRPASGVASAAAAGDGELEDIDEGTGASALPLATPAAVSMMGDALVDDEAAGQDSDGGYDALQASGGAAAASAGVKRRRATATAASSRLRQPPDAAAAEIWNAAAAAVPAVALAGGLAVAPAAAVPPPHPFFDGVSCCVCNGEEGFLDNPIVLCDGAGCGIAVHQLCYGILAIPEGDEPWLCDVCVRREAEARGPASRSITPAAVDLPCPLCPLTGGAYKRLGATLAGNPNPRDHRGVTVRSAGWCHAVCAVWNPHVGFGDVRRMGPVLVSGFDAGSVCLWCSPTLVLEPPGAALAGCRVLPRLCAPLLRLRPQGRGILHAVCHGRLRHDLASPVRPAGRPANGGGARGRRRAAGLLRGTPGRHRGGGRGCGCCCRGFSFCQCDPSARQEAACELRSV